MEEPLSPYLQTPIEVFLLWSVTRKSESNRMFISMMENYERVTELTNAGLQSQGELAKANEVRVN